MIVFVGQRAKVEELAEALAGAGVRAAAIHGDMDQVCVWRARGGGGRCCRGDLLACFGYVLCAVGGDVQQLVLRQHVRAVLLRPKQTRSCLRMAEPPACHSARASPTPHNA